MFQVIYPNRWFVWTIVGIVVIGIFTWLQVMLYKIEILGGMYADSAQYSEMMIQIHKSRNN